MVATVSNETTGIWWKIIRNARSLFCSKGRAYRRLVECVHFYYARSDDIQVPYPGLTKPSMIWMNISNVEQSCVLSIMVLPDNPITGSTGTLNRYCKSRWSCLFLPGRSQENHSWLRPICYKSFRFQFMNETMRTLYQVPATGQKLHWPTPVLSHLFD